MDSDRNIYKEDVDFRELASQDVDFAKVLKSNGQLDFSDPAAVQQLTKSLLKRDFSLSLTLPPDRLCPPVPNRLNYILWIQDLLDTTSESYSDRYDPKREVIGLDIGTGASCIYPLLGCAQRPNWRFIATDIDDLSLKYAQINVTSNNLSSRIKLLKTTPSDPLIPLDSIGLENLSFTLCNPPFHPTPTAHFATTTALTKSLPPSSACTGSPLEMVYPGGETAFTLLQIAESLVLRQRVQWYSTMLGRLASVPVVVDALRDAGVRNWAVAEFVQGSRTRRWGVAWSFCERRPRAGAARAVGAASGVERRVLPFPGEVVLGVGGEGGGAGGVERDANSVARLLDAMLSELPLRWMWKPTVRTGVGFSAGNVWSRAARRKQIRAPREQELDEEDSDEEDDGEEELAFGFKITVKMKGKDGSQAGEGQGAGVQVVIRWLKGFDSALFESFCGMIKRKLEE